MPRDHRNRKEEHVSSKSVTTASLFSSARANPNFLTTVVAIFVAIAVATPLMVGGRVYLLDWSLGPVTPILSAATLGLNGGLTASLGGSILAVVLNALVGAATTWLLVATFFPVAMLGAARLVGGSQWSRLAAAALYAVNPFVFTRLFVGHLLLLVGYALLPYAVRAGLRSVTAPRFAWGVPALWWAVLTSLSPHFAWIYGVVIVGIVIVTRDLRPRERGLWFATQVVVFGFLSTYLWLPHSATTLPTQVGSVSLDLYRTLGDPSLGLIPNVLGLYGFWRIGPGPELPKQVVAGWPFLMAVILLIVLTGAVHVLRKRPKSDVSSSTPLDTGAETHDADSPTTSADLSSQRTLAWLLVFVGVVGFFLALGDQGPTGPLFLWAYNHVPFFPIMREPQKFLMLLALAYAVFFGWGIDYLRNSPSFSFRGGQFTATWLLALALPLGYTPTIFFGLAHQIAPSAVPASYQQADARMGTGPGLVLSLPWHLYLAYPFTNGRVVANITPSEFRRGVISGDNVQAGNVNSQSTSPRSAYFQDLFNLAPTTHEFGALVAPLGVKYVVLSKTVDWPLYGWLNQQRDLRLVMNTPAPELWRNLDYRGVGVRTTALSPVNSLTQLVTLANEGRLHGRVPVFGSSASLPPAAPSSLTRTVHQVSPITYRIGPGPAGWVSVDAPYQEGWSFDGTPAIESATGTVLVHVGAAGGTLTFTPWRLVRLGYVISLGLFVLLCAVAIYGRRRSKRLERLERTGHLRRLRSLPVVTSLSPTPRSRT